MKKDFCPIEFQNIRQPDPDWQCADGEPCNVHHCNYCVQNKYCPDKEMTHKDFLDKLKYLFDNKPEGMHLVFLVAYKNENGELKDLSAVRGDTEHVLSTVINFFNCNPQIEKEYQIQRLAMALTGVIKKENEEETEKPINKMPV